MLYAIGTPPVVSAASIWSGDMICIAAVARQIPDFVDGVSQLTVFRSLGRR